MQSTLGITELRADVDRLDEQGRYFEGESRRDSARAEAAESLCRELRDACIEADICIGGTARGLKMDPPHALARITAVLARAAVLGASGAAPR